jgi:hypothetical protein
MQNIDMLLDTTREFLHQIAAFLPLLVRGYGRDPGRLAICQGRSLRRRKGAARGQLQRLDRTRRHRSLFAAGRAAGDTTTLFGIFAFWVVIIAALIIAFNGWD